MSCPVLSPTNIPHDQLQDMHAVITRKLVSVGVKCFQLFTKIFLPKTTSTLRSSGLRYRLQSGVCVCVCVWIPTLHNKNPLRYVAVKTLSPLLGIESHFLGCAVYAVVNISNTLEIWCKINQSHHSCTLKSATQPTRQNSTLETKTGGLHISKPLESN